MALCDAECLRTARGDLRLREVRVFFARFFELTRNVETARRRRTRRVAFFEAFARFLRLMVRALFGRRFNTLR
jgi:hypothetical protein